MQFLKKKCSCLCHFSDALRQMETIRPMSDDEFTTIDGVGKAKLEK
jgi:ATP-dependent DNA helicase RecQ